MSVYICIYGLLACLVILLLILAHTLNMLTILVHVINKLELTNEDSQRITRINTSVQRRLNMFYAQLKLTSLFPGST